MVLASHRAGAGSVLAPKTVRKRPKVPVAWPVYALLWGFTIWWALGLHAFIWPVLAVPMAVHLLRARTVRVPRGGGLLLLFVLWVALSALQLDDAPRLLAFGYRFSLYASALILFLFLANLTRQQLPTDKLAMAAGSVFVVTVVGGYLGLLLQDVSFRSVTELLLPESISSDPFIYSLVHPEFGSDSSLLGYTVARPKMPYNYTNEWGSNFALTLPLAVYSFIVVKRTWWRFVIAATLVTSIVPMIVSINRGLWISLTIGLVYVAARAAGRGRVRLLIGVLGALGATALAVVLSPLGGIVLDRAGGNANLDGRTYLYEASIRAAFESPVLGYGAPIPSDDPGLTADASVGTHGQLWTILVSQGVPGVVLLVGFIVASLFLTWKVGRSSLWVHAVLVILLVQMPFYNFLPTQMHVLMIAIVICWRDIRGRAERRLEARDAAPTSRHARPPSVALPRS